MVEFIIIKKQDHPLLINLRVYEKNYAGIGYTYNRELDAFIPPRSSDLEQLNLTTCLWELPEELEVLDENEIINNE